MTREEEINNEALNKYPIKERENKKATGSYDSNLPRRKAFEEGAKWADKTMIERACRWLLKGGYFVNNTETINDFKKAMEE